MCTSEVKLVPDGTRSLTGMTRVECPPPRDNSGRWWAGARVEAFECAARASAVRPRRGFHEIPSLTAHGSPQRTRERQAVVARRRAKDIMPPRGEFRDGSDAAYFAATPNPWMIASMSDDCAAAWSARLVMVSWA